MQCKLKRERLQHFCKDCIRKMLTEQAGLQVCYRLVFGRWEVLTSAGTPVNLAENFRGFPQSLKVNTEREPRKSHDQFLPIPFHASLTNPPTTSRHMVSIATASLHTPPPPINYGKHIGVVGELGIRARSIYVSVLYSKYSLTQAQKMHYCSHVKRL
jgi:hypothetical protein